MLDTNFKPLTLLYILMILAIGIVPSYLQAVDLFSYQAHIEIQDDNTQTAKSNAIQQAREEAINAVMSKITLLEDKQKIQELLEDYNLYSFEQGFTISKEVVNKNIYIADINFSLNKATILNFLKQHNISYSLSQFGRYLIIPVYQENDKTIDDINTWSELWINNNSSSQYLSTHIYYKTDTLDFEKEYLTEIKNNFNVDDVVIITLNKTARSPLKQDLTQKEHNKDDTEEPILTNASYTLTVNSLFSDDKSRVEHIQSMNQAFILAHQIIEDDMKKQIIQSYSKENTVTEFKISFQNYADFVFIENTLKNYSEIENWQIVNIHNDTAVVSFKHKRNLENLKNSLTQYCIFLDLNQLTLIRIENCSNQE